MKFSFKNLKKNLIAVWGFSYALVIFIMLLVLTITIGVYNQSVTGIFREFNDYVFKTVTGSVNDTLLSMNNLYLSLMKNDDLSSFLSAEDNFSQHELVAGLASDFRLQINYVDRVDRFFIYLKDSDTVLSESGITDSFTYYITYFDPSIITFEKWKENISPTENLQYITMYCKNANGQNIDALAMLFKMPGGGDNATGVVLSGKWRFMESAENAGWKNLYDIYVYNRAGNLVMYNKHSTETDLPETISQVIRYRNTGSLVYTSDVIVNSYGWNVAAVVHSSELSRSLIVTQIIIISAILMTLLMLFFIVRYILKKNYRPIKTMLSFFGVTQSRHEYENLYSAINNTLLQKQSLLKDIEHIAISRIIKGELSYLSPQEYSNKVNGKYFAVISFYLEDISMLFCNEATVSDFERWYHMSYIIDNVMTEIFNEKKISVYTTEIDKLVVCLVNLETKISEKEIKELAERGLSFINKNFDIPLTFALSLICEGLSGIPAAYNQTLDILDYKRMIGIKEPLLYMEPEGSPNGGYVFDTRKEQALMNNIKAGNHKDALDIVGEVFQELEENKEFPLDYVTYVILDIASTITKSANEILPSDFNFDNEITLYKKIKSNEILTNLKSQITEYIINVCEGVKAKLQNKNTRAHLRTQYIQKYVHDNYTNPGLSVDSIGAHLDLAPSYISRIFKDETGLLLLDYINKMRITYARKLMEEGQYSMKEISQMAGFANERTFYRVLKKLKEL